MTATRRNVLVRLTSGVAGAALWVLGLRGSQAGENTNDDDAWTIYITNDTCPDYTWGCDEATTRSNLAELVRAHLDQMIRDDRASEPDMLRDRYNMAVTQEALCFVERYPGRKDELVRRIKEDRVFVSPFLCNSLLGLQSIEGLIRTFYPARRLERDWGIGPLDVAEHIECPSLPSGIATILAGCGIRWLSKPFYDYDCTFSKLTNPPLFEWEGPDGSTIRVVLDAWASSRASYAQGAVVLKGADKDAAAWVDHYRGLGAVYPVHAILASGTHGDTTPKSAGQSGVFARQIRAEDRRLAAAGGTGARPRIRLMNATLSQFCRVIDEAQKKAPFLPTVRGDFGQSWEVWPVSLAQYVADGRDGERSFLAAETLVALVDRAAPQAKLARSTRAHRRRAEWSWAMLADHAWNGTDDANREENARLRRVWSYQLSSIGRGLIEAGSRALGLEGDDDHLTLVNTLSVPRGELVKFELPPGRSAPALDDEKSTPLAIQAVNEDGRWFVYLVAPEVPGFGVARLLTRSEKEPAQDKDAPPAQPALLARDWELESPFYRLRMDRKYLGIASLVHKPSGTEMVLDMNSGLSAGAPWPVLLGHPGVTGPGSIGFFPVARSSVATHGPVLARLKIDSSIGEGQFASMLVTLYRELDRVDLDLRINPPRAVVHQLFPILLRDGSGSLRIETPAAIVRPDRQPDGDLLPGADICRFAAQGFIEAAWPKPQGFRVTVAPLDAFAVMNSFPVFELLGNDQNPKEVTQDQGGVTEFRYRYSIRGRTIGADADESALADTVAWSRSVATPLLAFPGRLSEEHLRSFVPPIVVDPKRAIATCLKPADDETESSLIVRLWETAGRAGRINLPVAGWVRRVVRTDLLERNGEDLPIKNGQVELTLRPRGLAALRLG